MCRQLTRRLALLAPVPILVSLTGLVVGCRTQTTGQAADGQKNEQPARTKNEGSPVIPHNGGKPADGQEKKSPPQKGKATAKPAYQFPLEIKVEAPEVPEAIRRPSPPIPKKADHSRSKK